MPVETERHMVELVSVLWKSVRDETRTDAQLASVEIRPPSLEFQSTKAFTAGQKEKVGVRRHTAKNARAPFILTIFTG